MRRGARVLTLPSVLLLIQQILGHKTRMSNNNPFSSVRKSPYRYGPTAFVYCFVAVASALTEWVSFLIVGRFVTPIVAALAAFIVATGVNYELSRGLAFLSKRARGQEALLVFLMSALAFLFNLSAFVFCMEFLLFPPLLAKIIGTGAGFIMNYVFRQFVIFSREPRFDSWTSLAQLATSGEANLANKCQLMDRDAINQLQSYLGHRILEAMQNAPNYADAVYRMMKSSIPPESECLLDFGAGQGTFAERLLREGRKIDCVEPDITNQRSLASIGLSPVADIAALDGNHYDFIYTINVLEHLSELDRGVAELHRVLRPSGRLFAFVPAFAILWTSLDDEVAHVRQFTHTSLTHVLQQNGFVVEQCRYFDSLGFAAALCVRALEALNAFHYSPRTIGFYDRVLFPLSLFGDRVFAGTIGKNVVAIARKPTAGPDRENRYGN